MITQDQLKDFDRRVTELHSYLKIEDNYFEKISLLLAVIYVINELRLDYLIVSKL